ncbi:MAG: ABC transporter permease subunit [Planctomycetes bacterium]|nr:ABC transporter permease subunit [Planctomycetota bacterium]
MRDGADSEPSFVSRWLRSKSARAAACVLVLWFSTALFAPFLAGDRPYWMRAVDLGRHEAARTSLEAVTRAWVALEAEGESAWNARRPAHVGQRYAEALALEERAAFVRVATLRAALAPEETAAARALDEFRAAAPATRMERATAVARALRPHSIAAAAGDTGGVRLVSTTSTPLLSALSGVEAALAAGWISVWIALLVLRSLRARIALVAVTLITVGGAWRPLVGDDTQTESIKAAIARGDIVVESAVFPPLPMGPSETHMREAYRPPTWLAGARAASPSERDAGFKPGGAVQSVTRFEPALDSPWRHILGTDSLGRDLLARLIFGARVSLFVGNAAAVLLTLIGILLGVWAGRRRGLADFVVSRTIEVVMCFPGFVLVLCALFFVDPQSAPPLVLVALLIGLVGWTGVARLVRAETLRIRELDYIAAARAAGVGESAILWRHILPNAVQPAIIAFAFAVGAAVLTESALSFLGFGVQIPTASWGALVSDSKSADHAWIWVVPGLAIFSVVASYNILGEALRDALDPRHER